MDVRKSNYYKLLDQHFINTVKQKHVDKTVTNRDKHMQILQKWVTFFNVYLSDEQNYEKFLPENYSCSQVLPFNIVVTDGDAGTGKTYSVNALYQQCSDAFVTGYSAKSAQAFLQYADRDNIMCGNFLIQNYSTICKCFRIKFSYREIQVLLKKIENDEQLENAYVRMAAEADNSNLCREAFIQFLKSARNLVKQIFRSQIKEFLKDLREKHASFRHRVLQTNHPHYTSDDMILTTGAKDNLRIHDASLTSISGEDKEELEPDYAEKIVNPETFVIENGSILTQEAYRTYVHLKSHLTPPPPCVLYPCMVYEEDGETVSFMSDLRKVLTWLNIFVYLPPFMFDRVPTIVCSGSKAQSHAIGSFVSSLDLNSLACVVNDNKVSSYFKSENFRRSNEESIDQDARRLTCLNLERSSLDLTDMSFQSLFLHEEDPADIENPEYETGTLRLYKTHNDVAKYVKKTEKRVISLLPVTDIVFVSDLLVPLGRITKEETETNRLSGKQAREAFFTRMGLWKEKKSIYHSKDSTCANHTECDFSENQVKFYPQTEASITKCRIVSQKLLKQTTMHDETGFEEIDEKSVSEEEWLSISHDKNCRQLDKDNDIKFICGLARDGLSEKEHFHKRRNCKVIADKLDDGRKAASVFLASSKAVDQIADFVYRPEFDFYLEFASPDYANLEHSLKKNVHARILYMPMTRTRHIPEGCLISLENMQGSVLPVGISATFEKLYSSTSFENLCADCTVIAYDWYITKLYELFLKNFDDCPLDHLIEVKEDFCTSLNSEYCKALKEKNEEKQKELIKKFEVIENQIVAALLAWQERNKSVNKILKEEPITVNFTHHKCYWIFRNLQPFLNVEYLKRFCTQNMTFFDAKKIGVSKNAANTNMQRLLFMESQKDKFGKILLENLKQIVPDLYKSLINHVLVDEVTIVELKPYLNTYNRWQDIFCTQGEETKSKFGNNQKKRDLYFVNRINNVKCDKQKLFSFTSGHLMNLPEFFCEHATPEYSMLVAKGKNEIIKYSGHREAAKNIKNVSDQVEMLAMFGFFQPIFGIHAQTVSSTQGITCHSKIFANLQKQSLDNILVTLTRSTKLNNLSLGNIEETQTWTESNERKKRKKIHDANFKKCYQNIIYK